jgi:hypothetical protein
MGMPYFNPWAGIAQSVWLPATGWTFRGSSPGWGRDFPHSSRPALGPTQPPECWVLTPYHGSKAVGSWRGHPPPSRTEVKDGVELYLYSPVELSRPVLGWPLPLLYLTLPYFIHFFAMLNSFVIFFRSTLGNSNIYRCHSWLCLLTLRNIYGWNFLFRLLIIISYRVQPIVLF